jgi:hypothetical protein
MSQTNPAFATFATYWRLSEGQASRFWHALSQSQDPVVRSWRQRLLVFPATRRSHPWHDIRLFTTPATVVEVLESLIAEGALPSREARQIEEHILGRVDRDGRWCENRPPVREPWWGAIGALLMS